MDFLVNPNDIFSPRNDRFVEVDRQRSFLSEPHLDDGNMSSFDASIPPSYSTVPLPKSFFFHHANQAESSGTQSRVIDNTDFFIYWGIAHATALEAIISPMK